MARVPKFEQHVLVADDYEILGQDATHTGSVTPNFVYREPSIQTNLK